MKAELKPGYKQTEVGVIPEDWSQTTIGEVTAKVGSGITPRGGSNKYKESGRPFVRSQNVGWGRLLLGDIAYIDDETHSTFAATELKEDDVLLNITGASIGRSALANQKLVGGNVNQHVCIIRSNSNGANPSFINHFLLSSLGQRQIDSFQAGGNREGLNFGQIRSIKLPLPPTKAEQEAIAEALSDTDALIESLEQLVAKKRQIKQGTMQELLTGKRRLPGFQVKAGNKQTDLGPIPQDWDVIPMGQISECLIGLTYSPLDVRDFGVLVLRSSNVQNGRLAFHDNVFVDMNIPARAITQKNDILICVRNGSRQLIGKCALVDDNTAGSAFGAFMSVLRSDSAKFLFFQFQSNILKRQIDEVMGATINQITNKDMAVFKVIWPSTKAEQEAIATILSDMDAEIAALETKLAKTRSLKQGMMHNLLTGRIRLL